MNPISFFVFEVKDRDQKQIEHYSVIRLKYATFLDTIVCEPYKQSIHNEIF